jgi:hypothetical protein
MAAYHRGGPSSIPDHFIWDKVMLEKFVSEYFGFPRQFSFHQFLPFSIIWGWYNGPFKDVSTKGFILILPYEYKKNRLKDIAHTFHTEGVSEDITHAILF